MSAYKQKTIKNIALIAFAMMASLFIGCFGQIDQALDCSNICNRFEECFDSDFDSESCTDECRDNAEEDQDFADQADACENCIDDRACSEDFSCVDECFGIVP